CERSWPLSILGDRESSANVGDVLQRLVGIEIATSASPSFNSAAQVVAKCVSELPVLRVLPHQCFPILLCWGGSLDDLDQPVRSPGFYCNDAEGIGGFNDLGQARSCPANMIITHDDLHWC